MKQINCLIVGLGIGQLYKKVCKDINYLTHTVDINTSLEPDFLSIDHALSEINNVDISIVTVPNYLHYSIAEKVAPHSKIVLVEKPGVKNPAEWLSLCNNFPATRFMMIKNNQYRDNIKQLFALYHKSKNISFNWINENRVPKPGSWFTDKNLSYGGVSRDLLPHLLSLFTLFEPEFNKTNWNSKTIKQNWELKDLTNTEYGKIDPQGIYNVDDFVNLTSEILTKKINITADWRSLNKSDIGIHFDNKFVELGLCPESAYANMLKFAYANVYNDVFWQYQQEQDLWIHKQIV